MKPTKNRFKSRNRKAARPCNTPARLRSVGPALRALRSLAGVLHGVNSKVHLLLLI